MNKSSHAGLLATWMLLACSTATTPTAKAAIDGDAAALPADATAAVDATADAAPAQWSVAVDATEPISLFYSQGIARVADGWIFSASGALWRTDEAFNEVAESGVILPDELTQLGFNHVGDIDVAEGLLYASVEQDDYGRNQQAVVRYDPKTLKYVDHVLLAQHEASFVAVEEATMTAYLADRYSDDKLLRYDVKAGWKPLSSLAMSQKVAHIQGADVALGALWLSAGEEVQGIYRVDLATGEVTFAGTLGHPSVAGKLPPEIEGIDATPLPSGLLHVITSEALKMTTWLDHVTVLAPK